MYSTNANFLISGNQGCSSNCKNNVCDTSQNCTEGCNDGYWGSTCKLNCSATCFRLACNQTVGKCIYGCIQGRFGDTCEGHCNSRCLENVCYQNGTCSRGCDQNWTGNHCDRKYGIQDIHVGNPKSFQGVVCEKNGVSVKYYLILVTFFFCSKLSCVFFRYFLIKSKIASAPYY